MKRSIFLASYCGFALIACSEAVATTYYVDVTSTCPGSGTQSSPWCQIYSAFGGSNPGLCGMTNPLNPGDTVLVLPGTYAQFSFCGEAVTVISQNGATSTIISASNSASKVKFFNNETESSILDGFTITGGTGHGIDCLGISPGFNATPTIKNCVITGNSPSAGGAVYLKDCSARISDCIIENNDANGNGGGIYILKDNASAPPAPQITRCLIQGNTASAYGGGIAVVFSAPVITNCVISENTANGSQGGGGVWVNDIPSAEEGGTAASPSCTTGCTGTTVVRLTNCLIVGNSAPYSQFTVYGRGGGLYLSLNDTQSRTEISNCTISGNTAAGVGDGIYAHGRCFSLVNSILWDDASGYGSELALDYSTAFVRYSDVEGGLGSNVWVDSAGVGLVCQPVACSVSGNIDANPLFADAPNDYHLTRTACGSGSPCIDTGDNAGVAADIADLDGDSNTGEATPFDLDDDPRRVNELCTTDTGCGTAPIVDMGAYEFQVIEAEIVDWKSVITHGASNIIGLVVGSDSTFSESRDDGIVKLRVSFSSPICASSVSGSDVTVCGNDVYDQSIDLSGITITTTVLSGDMGVDINFSPKLPNYARYRVRIDDVEDADCNVISTNNERILTALYGDMTGDRRVNATDVGGVRSLVPRTSINPSITAEVRSDVDTDNDIDENDQSPSDSDVEFVRDQVPKDARYIANPSCP